MKFFHTANGRIVLGAALGVVGVGFLLKQHREAVKSGKSPTETWAYKIGLVG